MATLGAPQQTMPVRQRPTTIAYHDVIDQDAPDASGFAGRDAARYKLSWPLFRAHLDAIAASVSEPPVTGAELLAGAASSGSWALTFDDGGASAVEIAAELSSRGWRGQFFVTTDRIGTPGFVSADELRALTRDGHLVGPHSHTHPQRMAACTPAHLESEWQTSSDLLTDLLGVRPVVAAIPGGWYSDDVARAAAAAGIRVLYSSEPVRRVSVIDGCMVVGRFAMLDRSSAASAGALARGSVAPRARRWASRAVLRPVKALSGPGYLKLRAALLTRRGR